MNPTRRQFVCGLSASSLLPGCSAAAAGDTVTPEAFGARGDGRANDTDAFAAMSAHVNARKSGTVVLRPVTYIVGKQLPSNSARAKFGLNPCDILHFVGCSGPLVVQGNGARLRCAGGLRIGTFDPRTRRPIEDVVPPAGRDKRASPYLGMIHVENCTGSIDISDIELDGNVQSLKIGGVVKGGWELIATGLRLVGNSGPERVSGVKTHHHAQDGMYLNGSVDRTSTSIISDVTCEDNGRQGCSITGGRNYSFERCRFRRTGRAGLRKAPAAGVDVEAQAGKTIRNLAFIECEFSDNAGFGMVAGTGDSEGATFTKCTFVGTTNWAAWPKAPRFRFSQCLFVGSINQAYGDPDPDRAARFMDCTFTDDPALSPTGQVFVGKSEESHPIAILRHSQNALFSRCRFQLVGETVLPASKSSVIYADCTMSQASAAPSRPVGTYLGTTSIHGNAKLAGSVIRGTVILNGIQLPQTS